MKMLRDIKKKYIQYTLKQNHRMIYQNTQKNTEFETSIHLLYK